MSSSVQHPPAWAGTVLRWAGAYNVAVAAGAVVMAEQLDARLGATHPPSVLMSEGWHAIAVWMAVMGLGFLLAARDAWRHWPVVLLGLLGKAGTSGWIAWDIVQGRAPALLWWWVAVDAIAWGVPLLAILQGAYEASLARKRTVCPEILRFALRRKTNMGLTLDELSRISPVLLVFLRHMGCTFCREALADLAARRREIEQEGARLVLVHMSDESYAARFFARYGLEDVQRISDPERTLYRAFGLPRGRFGDVLGPKVWWRGFQAGVLGGHGVGRLMGDGFQMPGVFLLFHGEIIRSYRHQSAADRPDYLALVTGRNYAAPEFSDR
ncbi:MAG: AhpC/TSA family protein [Bryobacteraceae bacterium]|nr:AhpC/TSA family protein [Bryobacteraceae bacterium]MCX7605618.1 AhpC/TSA family protein [Bryobacteraceae bacterium]